MNLYFGNYLPAREDVLKTGEDILEEEIRYENRIFRGSFFLIKKDSTVGGVFQDITQPVVKQEEIINKAKKVIETNLGTVQKIAYLLGENASETEITLNLIIESFTGKKAKHKNRNEAMKDNLVDYVLTFEELGAMFIAKEIDINHMAENQIHENNDMRGYLFPISGGVSGAVKKTIGEKNNEFKPFVFNGIDKKSVNQLKVYAKGKCPYNFLEIMVCEGGCIGGQGVISSPKLTKKWLDKITSS